MNIAAFRNETKKYIPDAEEIEEHLRDVVEEQINDYGLDASVIDVILTGSRTRGYDKPTSDLDAIVRYTGDEKEDIVFITLAMLALEYHNMKIDFIPTKKDITEILEHHEKTMSERKHKMTHDASKSEKVKNELVTMLKDKKCKNIKIEKEKLTNETLFRVICTDVAGDEIIYSIMNDGSINMKDDANSVDQSFKSLDELKKSLFLSPKTVEPDVADEKKKLYKIVVRSK